MTDRKITQQPINQTAWAACDTFRGAVDAGQYKDYILVIELLADSVVKKSLTTAADGKFYRIKVYTLDAILAVGYRICSPRGAQFRRWVTTVLRDYLVKGFAMDDDRLKQAERWDYFDEWSARIRDIRASEKRFYQKVRDLYATAVDYNKTSPQAQDFFKKVQNKMLRAVTGKTAAELIECRSDPAAPNMGLTHWKGPIVRKGDVGTAKNYLKAEEIEEFNRIVVMYLDYAEDQACRRHPITMAQWSTKLDAFLSFNDRDVLTHADHLQMTVVRQLAAERFQLFDAHRRAAEAVAADEADIAALEAIEENRQGAEKERRAGMMSSVSGSLSVVPEGWRQTRLENVVTVIKGGGTPDKENLFYWNGNIP